MISGIQPQEVKIQADKDQEWKASEFRNKVAEVFKMIYWNSVRQFSEFRKMRFELVKIKKILFRNTYFGVQVYEVIDHIFIRNQALQPRVKKISLVQEKDKKYFVIRKLFSSYLIGDFISSTLDASILM